MSVSDHSNKKRKKTPWKHQNTQNTVYYPKLISQLCLNRLNLYRSKWTRDVIESLQIADEAGAYEYINIKRLSWR